MDELVGFLRARYDETVEREHGRRRTIPSPFDGHDVEIIRQGGEDVELLVDGHPYPMDRYMELATEPAPDRFVLADIEAKRELINLHPYTTQRKESSEAQLRLSYGPNWERRLTRLDVPYCTTCDVADGMIQGDGTPCPTLRLLALPYADHPDYDESWKP